MEDLEEKIVSLKYALQGELKKKFGGSVGVTIQDMSDGSGRYKILKMVSMAVSGVGHRGFILWMPNKGDKLYWEPCQ